MSPTATDYWTLLGLRAVAYGLVPHQIHWTAVAVMGCRGAKDTPPPRHVKDVSNQSLLDSGISRPTTLASLAIRSDCVSSDCGKNLSFSSFCLRSDSK